jgi:hypothetical protein
LTNWRTWCPRAARFCNWSPWGRLLLCQVVVLAGTVTAVLAVKEDW